MIAHCRLCGECFAEDLVVQDETWNTDISDEQATLAEEGWYSDDKETVLCPDCVETLEREDYDLWAWQWYKEDHTGAML